MWNSPYITVGTNEAVKVGHCEVRSESKYVVVRLIFFFELS